MNGNEFLRGKVRGMTGELRLSLIFKVITFLIIIAGAQIATQQFALAMGWQAGWLGEGVYSFVWRGKEARIYPPWYIFLWIVKYYKITQVHPYLLPAAKTAGGIAACAIVFYLFCEFVFVRSGAQNIFGTARWAQKADLKRAGLLQNKGGVILGQLANAKLSTYYDTIKDSVILNLVRPAQKIIQSGIYNTMLSAPTRSGKGVSSVVPTLVSYPGSVIVLDFKGENFNLTSGFRARFGKVYRWEPTGSCGHHFNPMEEIRDGDNAFSDANLIADILTTPASGGSSSAASDHFITAARDFLTGLILHCRYDSAWKNKSLPGCREFLAQTDPTDPENTKYIYDLMINANHGDPVVHQAVVESSSAQRKRPEDEGGSVLSTVNNALAVFADTNIKRNTQESEFYIDEFEQTKTPIALYLTIQYSDVQRISPLIRMFVTLFSRRFTGGQTQATNRKFKVPLLFVLDEFDKLGRMDELEMNMGIHNGFGIHYFIIFQSLNQLNKIYTKEHSFLAHCRSSVFYAPGKGEYESAEMLSRVCGKESFSKANISYSGGRGAVGFNNASLSANEQERSLINPDEIMNMPLDCFILMCQGMPPYIGKKNVYYKDKVFTSRLLPPAFSTREEAVKKAASTIKKLELRRRYKTDFEKNDDDDDDDVRDIVFEDDAPDSVSKERLEGIEEKKESFL